MNVFKRFRPGYELVTEHFEWSVQVPFLQTSDRNGKQIESLLFACHEDPDSRWRLRLTDQKTKLSIHMWRCNSEGQNVIITDPILVKISILGGDKKKVLRQLTTTKPNSQMLKVFFYKDEVKLINSECRQDDGSYYTFRCRILCHVKMETIASADVPSGLAMDCRDGLITHMEKLFDTMQMSDVIFNFGDRQFPAHKLILAARSEVFAAMFQDPAKENSTNQITIEDVEPEVFHELLRFVYTGRVSLEKMESLAAGLFIAADKYLLDDLKLECEIYLLHNMSPDNCAVLLLHGELTNPTEHLNEAAKFFRHYPSQVMATDGWKRMKKENPASLFNILEFVYRYK